MKHPFFAFGGLAATVVLGVYVGAYFFSVSEGALSSVGLSCKPTYRSPFSERNVEKLFSPIHAVDRKFLRRAKWGDALEEQMFAVYVPPAATATTCKFHHTWRTNATVPVTYGT